jgi:zinc transport system permease protein
MRTAWESAMTELLELLSLPFMQRAMIAGLLLGCLASYLGAFIVQRGLGFLGDGLAHAAFGGVALGLLLRTEPLYVAVPFTVGVALAINWVKERAQLSGDTAIGVFFATSVALGIVFLSLKDDYTVDAFAYVFGSILAVGNADVWSAVILAASAVATLPLWPRWAYASFDRELALTDRIPVRADDYALSAYTALTVVLAVKILGVVLVSAFLIIPAATARAFSRSFRGLCWGAVGIGAMTSTGGLIASYYADAPSGATIVLLQAALFFASLLRGRAHR